MKKIYTLSSCNSCVDMLKEAKPTKDVEIIDIKKDGISAVDLDYAAEQIGSYEALFSRKAMKYRSMGLADKKLKEKDYRKLILEEYTFLLRPLTLINGNVTIGKTKEAVAQLKENIKSK
jgi:arsenate reductase (glutaredoxin)